MSFKNTKDSYGFIAKFFHWFMALLILGLILIGLYITTLEYNPLKLELIYFHKSFGLLVLWLVGLRIIWKVVTIRPAPHSQHALWERLLAKAVHILLYIAMIGMPLTGWLMSSAGEYPVPFFGIQMPDLVDKNTDLAKSMNQAHTILGYVLIGIILLHALGALKHHFIDEDSTLTRMMVKPMAMIEPYALIIILGLFVLGVLSFGSIEKLLPQQTQEEKLENIEEIQIRSEISNQNQWKIIKDQSSLNFQASIYSKEFTGQFQDFDGIITFNPNDLKNSKAEIIINMSAVNSGDAERDQQILTNEWFDVEAYPTATFKVNGFEVKDENNYIAIGELMIKNRSTPLLLPFQLDIVENQDGRRAYMSGSAILNRLDYGLGEARWEAADSIGLEVVVGIKLVASAP